MSQQSDKSGITLYYCVRNLHDPGKPTEYYQGGGQWKTLDLSDPNSRIALRLWSKEEMAKALAYVEAGVEWFAVQIEG